jgi:hypothetical protein
MGKESKMQANKDQQGSERTLNFAWEMKFYATLRLS